MIKRTCYVSNAAATLVKGPRGLRAAVALLTDGGYEPPSVIGAALIAHARGYASPEHAAMLRAAALRLLPDAALVRRALASL